YGSLADWLSEQLPGIRQQRFCLFVGNWRLTVPRRQRHQARDCRSAKNRLTCAERTKPAGSTRRSSCADALVTRPATPFTASWVTPAPFPTPPPGPVPRPLLLP